MNLQIRSNLYIIETQGMVRWVTSRADEDLDECVKSLVPLIRFAMMSADQLVQVEQSEFFTDKREIMSSYLSEAHQFRSLACEVSCFY